MKCLVNNLISYSGISVSCFSLYQLPLRINWITHSVILYWYSRQSICLRLYLPKSDIISVLAATKQLYELTCLSVCQSFRLSHLFDYVSVRESSWNLQELSPWTKVMSVQKWPGRRTKVKVTEVKTNFASIGHSWAVPPALIYRWLRSTQNGVEKVFYCISMSSFKFQSLMGGQIDDFVPIHWVFLDCNASLNSQMTTEWCKKLDVV